MKNLSLAILAGGKGSRIKEFTNNQKTITCGLTIKPGALKIPPQEIAYAAPKVKTAAHKIVEFEIFIANHKLRPATTAFRNNDVYINH